MSLRWNDIGRLIFYALGGATVCSAAALATIVTEKKIGRQLLIPTKTVHMYENLRCLLCELENLVLPLCEVIYLKLLGDMDRITTARAHLLTRPKELDPMFCAHIVSTYISMVNEGCNRMVFEFEKKHKDADPAKCKDVRVLLADIKKTMFNCVTSVLLMSSKYPQVPFNHPTADHQSS